MTFLRSDPINKIAWFENFGKEGVVLNAYF